jgi:endonuclease/exonuclease/phosphatase family metal-dependent hydrolase
MVENTSPVPDVLQFPGDTRYARARIILRVLVVLLLAAGCARATQETTADVPESVTWRVVSYNIRHGRGMDDRVDLERTARVLRRLDADIIALQEVDAGVARSGGEDQAELLADRLGMHHAFGSFMDYQGGRYGMAILARPSIRKADPVRLTEGNEPRVALAVEIVQPDGGVLTIVNVHFDWVRDDGFRFAQAREVVRFLHDLSGPWILAGDFNDQPGSRTLNLFHETAREAVKPRERRFTFSSMDPRREIDFVFVSPAHEWSVGRVEVVDETMASDHLPMVAELVLPAG